MRMKVSTLFLTSVVILSVLLIPTVLASKPMPITGYWNWKAPHSFFDVEKVANGNVFYHADDDAKLNGTFVGTGIDEFTMTFHPNGFYTGSGRTEFTGTVMGKSGTLVIMWVGNTKNDDGWWWFKWVIISGTGELADLRGQGTCWGPGPSGPGVWGWAEMTGKIHFDPS